MKISILKMKNKLLSLLCDQLFELGLAYVFIEKKIHSKKLIRLHCSQVRARFSLNMFFEKKIHPKREAQTASSSLWPS